MHLGDKTSVSEIRPPVPVPVCKGFAVTNFAGAGPFPHFFLSCAINQSIDGKHLITRLFKMYGPPNKMSSPKASIRVSLLTGAIGLNLG